MKKIFFVGIIFFFLICGTTQAQTPALASLFLKDSITIVVTDSGLGGLSVVAEIEKNMRNSGHFQKINLIFANALFNETGGYNALPTRDEKIRMFNDVLNGINKNYHPDLILVACNTLSTILKETDFAKTSKIPVIGIVDIGVEEIKKELDQSENSKVLIFGTETTIEEDTYRSELVALGIENSRIISQACPQLQNYIEINPDGEDTEMLIMSYVDEALEKAGPKNTNFCVSLNCTHFGYSMRLWQEAFDLSGKNPLAMINPNIQMSGILLNNQFANRYPKTVMNIQVVSKVKIADESVKSISEILKKMSVSTSSALVNYQWKNDLF